MNQQLSLLVFDNSPPFSRRGTILVALDQTYIDAETFQMAYEQAAKTKGFIGGLKRSLWKNPHTPSKTPKT